MFDPSGAVRQIPQDQMKDAMAAGGKLAVRMNAPDGSTRYVPHDNVPDAIRGGGTISEQQGTPNNAEPKEGFWHSLGSVFGLTPEQIKAQQQQTVGDRLLSSAEAGMPGLSALRNAATTGPAMAKKSFAEGQASNEALGRGDIVSFLAHEIGGAGYLGATVLSPLLGNSTAKAGEQLGKGNIKGGLGTTAGIVAPVVAGGALKGKPAPIEAPNVFEGSPPAEIPSGTPANQPGVINRTATAIANAKLPPGANFIPKVSGAQKIAQFIANRTIPEASQEVPVYGNAGNAEVRGPYQPYQGDLKVNPSGDTDVVAPQQTIKITNIPDLRVLGADKPPADLVSTMKTLEPTKSAPAQETVPIKPVTSNAPPRKISLGEPTAQGDYQVSDITQGGKPVGKMVFQVDGDRGIIHWIGDENMQNSLSNQLGPTGLKQMFLKFAKDNPQIKTLEGIKVGGAQGEQAATSKVNISDLYGKSPQSNLLPEHQRQLAGQPGRVGVTHNPAPGPEIDVGQALMDSLRQRGINPSTGGMFDDARVPQSDAEQLQLLEESLMRLRQKSGLSRDPSTGKMVRNN